MFHPLRRFTRISSAGKQWEVNLSAEKVSPELLEPVLGINFARDGIPNKDWLYLVALHSDVWLLTVAFFFGASFGFDKADRIFYKLSCYTQLALNFEMFPSFWCRQQLILFTCTLIIQRLFNLINDLPTVSEVVSGSGCGKKQPKEKSKSGSHNG